MKLKAKHWLVFSPVLIGLWEEGLLRGLLNILYWRYSLQIKVVLALFEMLIAAKTLLISPPRSPEDSH
jgi:hypothetical protein